ncbi:MAG: SPASM domain-containing protein [Saprospiraceae bacterium]|nr:SPASM domain-containing protein [Saprospiraceae bacterium]
MASRPINMPEELIMKVIDQTAMYFPKIVGTLYDQSLKEIWNSQVFSKFRLEISDAGGFFPACSRCCSAFGG